MSEARAIVDWGIAARIGGVLAGSATGRGPDPGHTRRASDLALRRVREYTGLDPVEVVPEVELIGRHEWIESNIQHLRDFTEPLAARASGGIGLPWPLAGIASGALGAVAGAEVGGLMGYASRRVLGQYQVHLTVKPQAPRMFLIAENLDMAARSLGVDANRFLLWVLIHEQTHSVQFASVPWLREHLAGLLDRLLTSASDGIDVGALTALAKRLLAGDPRDTVRDALRGELSRALVGPEQAGLIDELQAVMAVIEGYAEHVMDAAAVADDGLGAMRPAMDRRRRQPAGLADVIARAFGLGAKLRQYELGRAFSDDVVDRAGIAGLNQVWSSSAALPSLAELEAPAQWIDRVGLVAHA